MRNLDLVDAVITLHNVARLVAAEVGSGQLHDDIRNCADRLHQLSIFDAKNATITHNIINKAKE